MKILFSDRTLDFKYLIDDEDRARLPEVEQLLSGHYSCRKCGTINDTRAWETVRAWFTMGREAILESLKQGLHTLVQREKSEIKAAMFDGFEKATSTPLQIISSWRMEREADKRKKKETDNVRRAFDDI